MRHVLIALLFCLQAAAAFVAPLAAGRSALAPRAAPSMTLLVINGKKIDFPAGSSLAAACQKGGLKPTYSCKKGECGSCTVSVGGTNMKACVGKVPPEPRLKSLKENGFVVK